MPAPAEIESTILRLAAEAGAGHTISPNDAARALIEGAEWHVLMPLVRRGAVKLALDGKLVITRKGAGRSGRLQGRLSAGPAAAGLGRRRTGKQLRGAAGQPIGQKPDLFLGGVVDGVPAPEGRDAGSSPARHRWRPAAGVPIDRIGLDREARLAEDADRARHVMRPR